MSGKIEGIDEINGSSSRNKAFALAQQQMEKNRLAREQREMKQALGDEIQPDVQLKTQQGVNSKTTSSEETQLSRRVSDNFSSEVSKNAMKSGHAPVAINFADLSESKRQEFDKTSFVTADGGASVANAASHISSAEHSQGQHDDRGSDEGNKQASQDMIKEKPLKRNKL